MGRERKERKRKGRQREQKKREREGVGERERKKEKGVWLERKTRPGLSGLEAAGVSSRIPAPGPGTARSGPGAEAQDSPGEGRRGAGPGTCIFWGLMRGPGRRGLLGAAGGLLEVAAEVLS